MQPVDTKQYLINLMLYAATNPYGKIDNRQIAYIKGRVKELQDGKFPKPTALNHTAAYVIISLPDLSPDAKNTFNSALDQIRDDTQCIYSLNASLRQRRDKLAAYGKAVLDEIDRIDLMLADKAELELPKTINQIIEEVDKPKASAVRANMMDILKRVQRG